MDPSVIMEVPNTTARRLVGSDPWAFTWGLIRRGDCTMLEGATWTLYPDGTATFRGTVVSDDDDDAWTIWHVDLVDADGAILGSLINQNPVPGGDHRKFVQSMQCGTEQYAFRAWATFETSLWNDIAGLKMHSS
jgi:uncharacterized protein DUF6294